MRKLLIQAVVASSVLCVGSPLALAQGEEEEEAPPPPAPPPAVVHVRPRPPAGPTVIVAQPPRAYITYQETAPDAGLIGAGLVMFGLSYGTSVVVGAASDQASDQNLYVPLAGPWMDLATRADCLGPCSPDETVNRVLLVADGMFQAAGALQVLGGFLFPQTRTITRAVPTGIHVAPKVGVGTVGISAYGAF